MTQNDLDKLIKYVSITLSHAHSIPLDIYLNDVVNFCRLNLMKEPISEEKLNKPAFNMELQLVTFEQAKALKELGFPINCTSLYYTNDGELYDWNQIESWHNKYYDKNPAPTLELVAKWLREEKGLHINYNVCVNKGIHKWNLYNVFDFVNDIEYDCFTSFNSYEEALSAGIDRAIEYVLAVQN